MFQKCCVALTMASQPAMASCTLCRSRASTNRAVALPPPWLAATSRACASLKSPTTTSSTSGLSPNSLTAQRPMAPAPTTAIFILPSCTL